MLCALFNTTNVEDLKAREKQAIPTGTFAGYYVNGRVGHRHKTGKCAGCENCTCGHADSAATCDSKYGDTMLGAVVSKTIGVTYVALCKGDEYMIKRPYELTEKAMTSVFTAMTINKLYNGLMIIFTI